MVFEPVFDHQANQRYLGVGINAFITAELSQKVTAQLGLESGLGLELEGEIHHLLHRGGLGNSEEVLENQVLVLDHQLSFDFIQEREGLGPFAADVHCQQLIKHKGVLPHDVQ
jgi:hypothetical protein